VGVGPAGWVLLDEGLDILAMILTCAALGFHPLLLPTSVIEFIPGIDMLPTWTGCTATVIMLRKRAQTQSPPPASDPIIPSDSHPPELPPPPPPSAPDKPPPLPPPKPQ